MHLHRRTTTDSATTFEVTRTMSTPESPDLADTLSANSHIVHWLVTGITAFGLWLPKLLFREQLDSNKAVAARLTSIEKKQSYIMGHLGIQEEET